MERFLKLFGQLWIASHPASTLLLLCTVGGSQQSYEWWQLEKNCVHQWVHNTWVGQTFHWLAPSLATTVIKKYKWVVENKKTSQLSETPTPEQLECWEAEILNAETTQTNKPLVMGIMATQIPKGKLVPAPSQCFNQADGHISTNPSPEAAWISGVTGERHIWRNCLDNFWPETWRTTVSTYLSQFNNCLRCKPTDCRWFNSSANWEGGHPLMASHWWENNKMTWSSHFPNSM